MPSGNDDGPDADGVIPNPFDPARLRIGQRFSEGHDVRQVLISVQVRKPQRQEFVREAATDKIQGQIEEPIDRQQPHAGEVPLQRATEPTAQAKFRGETEFEDR